MLRYRKRSVEVAVLVGSVVAAFIGSVIYQARARPGAAALQPLTLSDGRIPGPTDAAPIAPAHIPARNESASVATASSAVPPNIPPSSQPSNAQVGTDSTPLPVTVSVRDRRGAGLIDAILTNSSSSLLDLALESSNSSTGSASRITLQLKPAENRRVGQDDGLFMNPGDTLTVSSPPYPDLKVEVR